ncbi:MAG: ORF6N domain-containing protein [Candidatus Wallbacteria bacterium]|nr:ORF6N domain-containing protein [Candidatus Wallbacteria bacterium]
MQKGYRGISEVGGPGTVLSQKIYLIRGRKVMLDCDLAVLYGVKTKVLNQAVKRNAERFPEDFMFRLEREEIMNWSQFVTGSKIKHASSVCAFTEHGVAMLSGILKSGNIGSGLAMTLFIDPNAMYRQEFREIVKEAKKSARNIWNPADPLPETPSEYRRLHRNE